MENEKKRKYVEEKSETFERLDEVLLAEIAAFVGPNQYRFFAAVDRRFQKVYLLRFQKNGKKTYINASTVAHAKICFEEIDRNKKDFEKKLFRSAAKYGQLLVLQFLRLVRCDWDHNVCKNAAAYGHLHILQWARENGCPWSECTCAKAALNGHVDILVWAISNGGPWNYRTCSNLALTGQLSILQ